MMSSYFTRYFHYFTTAKAPGKKNLNMINDTADSCNSGKICNRLKKHRNSFAIVNCQGD